MRSFALNSIVGFGMCVAMSCLGQQPDITGLSLGMSYAEVQAKLAGYTITPVRVAYAPVLSVVFATKRNDGYLLEAVDGKLALIDHVTYTAVDQAPDINVYETQIKKKYGTPSPTYTRYLDGDQTPKGHMNWAWDAKGKQIDFTGASCPADFKELEWQGGPNISDSSGRPTPIANPRGVFKVPSPDSAYCHLSLHVILERTQSPLTLGQFNRAEFILEDPSLFFPAVEKLIAEQQGKAAAKQKGIENRSGPPM